MANTTDTMTPEEILRGIIDGSLTELEDDGVTAIGARKFNGRTALTRVSFSNFSGSIGSYAFNECTNLTSVDALGATSLGDYAFNGCTSLTHLNISNVTSIGSYALYNCTSLTGPVDFSKVTTLGNYTFYNCGITQSVLNIPKLQRIRGNGFRNLKNVEYINTGTATFESNGTGMFTGCTALKGFAQHRTGYTTNDYFGGSTFSDCPNLEYVDLGTQLRGSDIFKNCAKLKIIVCRAADHRALGNMGAVAGTPFASDGSGGTLYVRASLISTYQSATNWSTILSYPNNQIKSIESTATDPDAPIDLTQYFMDGTPIS